MIRAGLLLLAAAACARPGGESTPPPAPVASDEGAGGAAIRQQPGEILDLTVPLVDGGGLELAALRGRVVVLELTSASAPTWSETFAFYNRLLRQHGSSRLAVVVVSVDPERATLSPEPDLRGQGFELGWDPQGALAARLQAAALPTAVVLDRAGRIVLVLAGAVPGSTRSLEDSVRDALAE